MYSTYTRKKERIYRYYLCKSTCKFGASINHRDARVPAEEIEAAVAAQIHTVLNSPEAITVVTLHCQQATPPIDEATAVVALARIGEIWEHLFPTERYRICTLFISRIDLFRENNQYGIRITWRPLGWRALVKEFTPERIGTERLESDT